MESHGQPPVVGRAPEGARAPTRSDGGRSDAVAGPASGSGRVPRRAAALLLGVLILAGFAAFKVWLAGRESLNWMDEVFSFEIATKEVADLLDRAALDAHPPLYYLVLRSWLRLAEVAGHAPGTLWARLPGFACWLALLGVVALLPRRVASAGERTLCCVLVGVAPGVVQLTHDARSYVLAILGITAAFVGLAVDLAEPPSSSRPRGRIWIPFVAFSALAVWSHNLAWPAIGALMLAWSFLANRRGALPRPRRVAALASISLLLLVALPVLSNLPRQVHAVSSGDPTWMTPPSLGNLLRVFFVWFPLGRDGVAIQRAFPAAMVLAGLTWLPFALARRGARRANSDGFAGALASLGLATVVLFVVGTWLAARWLGLPTFHGPRYPLLVSGVWALASGGWISMSSRLRTRSSAFRSLLLAPCLASAILAAWVSAQPALGNRAGLPLALAELPARDEVTYYLPEELAPMFRRTLDRFGARSARELCAGRSGTGGRILFLNRWRELDRPETLLVFSAIRQEKLGSFSSSPIPRVGGDFELVEFAGTNWGARFRDEVCPHLAELASDRERGDGETADLTRLLRADGWSYLEFDRSLRPFRWTEASTAVVRFRRAFERGPYELRFQGHALASGSAEVVLPETVVLASARLDAGEIDLRIPFLLAAEARAGLELRLHGSLVERSGAGFPRRLGVRVRQMKVVPEARPR